MSDFIINGTTNSNAGAFTYSNVCGVMLSYDGAPTEFTNLYGDYKINWVRTRFIWENVERTNTSTDLVPKLHYVRDNDGDGAVGLADMQQMGCKSIILSNRRPVTIWWKPKLFSPLYVTGVGDALTTVGYSAKTNQWIDTDYPTVPHYGIKYAIENMNTSSGHYRVKMETTAFLQFKNPK